jgi:hypothetical protein
MRRLSLCCSIGLGVVFDTRSHTRYPPYELMSRNWYVTFCWTWYQEKRGPRRSISDEKSKTIPAPDKAVLSSFRIEFQLCSGPKSGTQRIPHHISPYCRQNSAYTDCFCPGGSVCSIPLEKVLLILELIFSCERDGQPNFKFDVDSKVLFIYRLIPRKFDFLTMFAALGATPTSSFLGASRNVPSRIQYNIEMFVSGYLPIHMHCIMIPVKFDGGMSISVQRNKQLFQKTGDQKFTFF